MPNPYRSSSSSAILSTPNHETARRIVVGIACFMVAQSIVLMLLQVLLFGNSPGVTQIVRLGLTGLLAFFLFAGSNIARYLTMVFYGFWAVMSGVALPTVYETQGLVFTLIVGLLVLANAAIPVLLKAPQGIDDQFS
ncbi:hypothetical protein Enr13x_70750 [Stieleria neptunia]|uniref:Uncharacterized protein n=1 Tax=Stieleria neptunia TaxID=2527979 RepID=A0A518I288_9BACT|nr:hypothetical protein [Stieleria neptunia]QDV47166.1 hypothetical protein Enr13x_70750 [Stieleria neptunia]